MRERFQIRRMMVRSGISPGGETPSSRDTFAKTRAKSTGSGAATPAAIIGGGAIPAGGSAYAFAKTAWCEHGSDFFES